MSARTIVLVDLRLSISRFHSGLRELSSFQPGSLDPSCVGLALPNEWDMRSSGRGVRCHLCKLRVGCRLD